MILISSAYSKKYNIYFINNSPTLQENIILTKFTFKIILAELLANDSYLYNHPLMMNLTKICEGAGLDASRNCNGFLGEATICLHTSASYGLPPV